MKSKYYLLLTMVVIALSSCAIGAKEVQTSRIVHKKLTVPLEPEGFSFAIFGDRTGGNNKEGYEAYDKAIAQVNAMRPDFVFTVGDLIQGYRGQQKWQQEAEKFNATVARLQMPFYPVAGNHEVYWFRDTKDRPKGHHERDYETYFGPLWYAFEYNGSWFVALYTDEGKSGTNQKSHFDPEMQKMSREQFSWLKDVLAKAKNANHVFVFMHHPRWITESYGEDWTKVHDLLKEASNVSAVFTGHFHSVCHDEKDDIDYYILGTTGGDISGYSLDPQHLVHWVNVRNDSYDVRTIALDSFIDPKTRKNETNIVVAKRDWATNSKEAVIEWELSTEGLKFEKGLFIARFIINEAEQNKYGIDLVFLDENKNEIERDKKIKRKGLTLSAHYAVESGKKYFLQLSDRDAVSGDKYPGKAGEIKILRGCYFKTE